MKEMWLGEIEALCDDYTYHKIDEWEFRRLMRRKGFTPIEIDEYVEGMQDDYDNF